MENINMHGSIGQPGDSPMPSPNSFTLQTDSFIIPAEYMAQIENEMLNEAEMKLKGSISNAPNAFVLGLSYTASWGSGPELSPEQLENIPVGIQDAALAPGSIKITATVNEQLELMPEETEAYQISKKLQKESAKNIAFEAQKKRVSRRLLLAERSKKFTVTCPITGIVSLLEVPAIPYPANNPRLAKALVWTSPLADLDNCRGIAQQGAAYLRRLDTQTLAGILIVLATHYELFRFQPFDSGAQKNAILRTAGKEYIIDAIVMIESLIHSNNCRFLPRLSLVFDSNLEQYGLEVRMQAYLKKLADAIAKPDKEVWDEKKVKPAYPIRPVYVRDIKNAQRKVSFLARQEQAKAKKEFAEDKKAGRVALSMLKKQVVMTDKMHSLMLGALTDEGLLAYPEMIIDAMLSRLGSFGDNPNAKTLIAFLKKDRKALSMTIEELEENITDNLVEEDEDNELDTMDSSDDDYATPGNESAIEEEQDEEDEVSEDSEDSDSDSTVVDSASDGNSSKLSDSPSVPNLLVPPAGLSAWEQLLWKKKMLAAGRGPRKIIVSAIPSVAVYIPSKTKEDLGRG